MCSLPVFGFIGWQRPPVMDKIPAGIRDDAVVNMVASVLALLVIFHCPFVFGTALSFLVSAYLTTLHVAKLVETNLEQKQISIGLVPELNLANLTLGIRATEPVRSSVEEPKEKISKLAIRQRVLTLLNTHPCMKKSLGFFCIGTPELNRAVDHFYANQILPDLNKGPIYEHRYELINKCVVPIHSVQQSLSMSPYDPNVEVATSLIDMSSSALIKLVSENSKCVSAKTSIDSEIGPFGGKFLILRCFDVLDELTIDTADDGYVCELLSGMNLLTMAKFEGGHARLDPPIVMAAAAMSCIRARVYKNGKFAPFDTITIGGRYLAEELNQYLATATFTTTSSEQEVIQYGGGYAILVKGCSELNKHPTFIRSLKYKNTRKAQTTKLEEKSPLAAQI